MHGTPEYTRRTPEDGLITVATCEWCPMNASAAARRESTMPEPSSQRGSSESSAATGLPVRSQARAASLSFLGAGAIGVLLLARNGASQRQLALQVTALVGGAIVAWTLARLGRDRLLQWGTHAALLGLVLLGATLFGDGLMGVHRWIGAGPFRLHASSLACPLLLAGIALLHSNGRHAGASALVVVAQTIHFCQPDAGQATAFAAGVIAVLAVKASRPFVGALFAIALAGATWTRPDPLVGVPTVEGVVRLAGDLGRPFQVVAIASLAAIPIALATRMPPAGEAASRSVGAGLVAYVAVIMLVPIAGNFPVPVMGFGVSPILGVAVTLGAMGALARRAAGTER